MQSEIPAALVRAAQGGSLPAFETLVQRFQDMAVAYSRVLLGDYHLAEDAAQDAFVQAYQRLGQLDDAAAFPGWFKQIVFSCCMRYRRRRGAPVQQANQDYLADPRPLPDRALEHKERATLLEGALAALNETEKTALNLYYIREYTVREIAAFLEVSPSTVQKRLRSAQNKLHGRLLTMTRRHIAHEAPSQDKTFTRRVLTQVEANCQGWTHSLVGSLHGVLKATGADWSLAQLHSVLGYAFHFCILPDGGRTWQYAVIEWELFFPLLDRLGFETQHFQAYLGPRGADFAKPPTAAELNKLREDTWRAVCNSIDQSLPAIAWSPMTRAQWEEGVGGSEWGLLVGYDEKQRTYTVHHRWRDNKPYTVPFDAFGQCDDDTGWYYAIAFGQHTPPDEQATVSTALADAVSFAQGKRYDKDQCCYPVAAVGFAAYEVWRQTLLQGQAAADATRLNADELKHNRQHAAAYLRQSAHLFEGPAGQACTDAAACYDMEVASLAEVQHSARAAHQAGKFTAADRRLAAAGVAAAAEADKLAIGHIEAALPLL
ncbi:MAG: sigma-70 family RNA polymerase sigma factor [Candidatus Latescibacteria bacterium]|nr:sigma-70 family RNA polymerase sigma factor [Candidatus Latescibacterota bacterium]